MYLCSGRVFLIQYIPTLRFLVIHKLQNSMFTFPSNVLDETQSPPAPTLNQGSSSPSDPTQSASSVPIVRRTVFTRAGSTKLRPYLGPIVVDHHLHNVPKGCIEETCNHLRRITFSSLTTTPSANHQKLIWNWETDAHFLSKRMPAILFIAYGSPTCQLGQQKPFFIPGRHCVTNSLVFSAINSKVSVGADLQEKGEQEPVLGCLTPTGKCERV